MGRLQGKIACVTGGSSGIGLATVRRFVEEGAFVFVVGRDQRQIESAVASIEQHVLPLQGDISSLSDLDSIYRQIKASKGHLDILHANASFAEQMPTGEASPEHFDKTFSVNARGTFFTVQKALPILRGGGSVILTLSGMWQMGTPGFGTYAATKAAMRSFIRTWAAELKERQIRVNGISPGIVDTPMIRSQASGEEEVEQLLQQYRAMTPLGRLGTPEDIAAAALFLASEESSFITGIDLPVDGGIVSL